MNLLSWLHKPTPTDLDESQFEEKCDAWVEGECGRKATWAAWSIHGSTHESTFCYCCDTCKKLAQDRWDRYKGATCVCGYNVGGSKEHHLRFMKL